jgi:hypothetical protein
MIYRRICDICHGPNPRHEIPFSRKVNGDNVVLETCDHCLDDISDYIDKAREHLDDFISAKINGIL